MKNLAAALIKAQMEMEPLTKDAKNPHFNSSYATLAEVQSVAIPVFGKYEIAVMQSVAVEWGEGGPVVKIGCKLYHAPSGEFLENELPLRPVKTDPQGIGSTITYGRRYLLMTMAGLAPEDDDGNAASKPVQKPAQQTQRPQPVVEHRNTAAAHPPEPAKSPAFKRFMAEGTTTFGKDWDPARHWLIERYTKKMTPEKVRTSANELSNDECDVLADTLVANRANYQESWSKSKPPVTTGK